MNLERSVRARWNNQEVPAIPLISPSDGHFIAGLLDAEAHFGMSEHNGGRSRRCFVAVSVRADDLDLLHWMRSLTGLGTIYDVQTTGNPQVKWVAGRRHETASIAGLLLRFPLRSRKRAEFELWKQAVDLWQRPVRERDVAAMERLRQDLIAQRIYSSVTADGVSWHVTAADAGLIAWLAGFLTGEAHFAVRQGAVQLQLHLRADDMPLLSSLQRATGVGSVYGPYVNRRSNPAALWSVRRTSELLQLAELLDARMRGRKAAEFEIWRHALMARANRSSPAATRRRLIDEREAELRQLRRYRAGRTKLPSAKSRRLQRMYEQNGVWIALLREWAASEPGPLGAEKYQRARLLGWPSRNTLAGRFGSWYDALAAAGLSHRTALPPAARDARVLGAAEGRDARRRAQRERVLAAFARCRRALGGSPGPTEYARWRLHNDPAAPAIGTAYKHFPGGWSELQAACSESA